MLTDLTDAREAERTQMAQRRNLERTQQRSDAAWLPSNRGSLRMAETDESISKQNVERCIRSSTQNKAVGLVNVFEFP